jgi:beta-galactosidase/beta-glucuronidase
MHESKTHPTIEFDKNEVIVSHPGVYSLDTGKKKKELKLSVATIEINDAWTLTFEEGWNAPSTLKAGSLISLADHENEAVSHYSGTVAYERDVEYQESGYKVVLDLGEVANIAEVWINNEKLGTRWAPPFKFDLTGKLKEGKNRLKVLVTNTWRNQLIYDWERPLNQKKTWTTNPPTNQNDLEMSGLIGPVILRTISKGHEL